MDKYKRLRPSKKMPRNNFFGCLFIFSSALNLFRGKKYLFSVAQYVLPMFLSCNISKCNWIRSGYSSKHFKRYISIIHILLYMGNFHGTPIIWFISSLFQKTCWRKFFAASSLVSHHRVQKMSPKQVVIRRQSNNVWGKFVNK